MSTGPKQVCQLFGCGYDPSLKVCAEQCGRRAECKAGETAPHFAMRVAKHFRSAEQIEKGEEAERLNLTVGLKCSCVKCGFKWEVNFPYGLPSLLVEAKSRRLYTRCPNGCRVKH